MRTYKRTDEAEEDAEAKKFHFLLCLFFVFCHSESSSVGIFILKFVYVRVLCHDLVSFPQECSVQAKKGIFFGRTRNFTFAHLSNGFR